MPRKAMAHHAVIRWNFRQRTFRRFIDELDEDIAPIAIGCGHQETAK